MATLDEGRQVCVLSRNVSHISASHALFFHITRLFHWRCIGRVDSHIPQRGVEQAIIATSHAFNVAQNDGRNRIRATLLPELAVQRQKIMLDLANANGTKLCFLKYCQTNQSTHGLPCAPCLRNNVALEDDSSNRLLDIGINVQLDRHD